MRQILRGKYLHSIEKKSKFRFLNEKPKITAKMKHATESEKANTGYSVVNSASPRENILGIFEKVYYIQSTDEQKEKSALTQMSKNLNLPLLTIQKQTKGTRVYERHLSVTSGIHRGAFVDRSKWQIDTFTFNMIRHLTADINKRQGLRIHARP